MGSLRRRTYFDHGASHTLYSPIASDLLPLSRYERIQILRSGREVFDTEQSMHCSLVACSHERGGDGGQCPLWRSWKRRAPTLRAPKDGLAIRCSAWRDSG